MANVQKRLEHLHELTRRVEQLATMQADKREDGVYISVGSVEIPTDEYKEVETGIQFRLIEGPNDIKFDDEAPFSEHLKHLNFNDTNIFIFFEEDKVLYPHVHQNEEQIRVLKGKIIDTINYDTKKAGETMIIPKGRIHSMQVVQEGCAISTLKK